MRIYLDDDVASAVLASLLRRAGHEVRLSRTDLERIFAGQTVTIETTDGHRHLWTIQLPSTGCRSQNTGSSGGGGSGGGSGGGGW